MNQGGSGLREYGKEAGRVARAEGDGGRPVEIFENRECQSIENDSVDC